EAAKLSEIGEFDGVVAVAVKSYANDAVATALRGAKINGSIVILQNGLGVEKPFLDLDCDGVCRCVLYMASQTIGPAETTFRSIASCPIGVVTGDAESAARCAEALTTRHFPFHPTPEIQRDVWKKAIINAVFNSICPLLEI